MYLTPCRRYHVAHSNTRNPKPCEVDWIGEVVRTEDLVHYVLG